MKKVKIGDTVTVNYTGKLSDGSIFDSSLNEGREPLTAKLGEGQLIKGFENGLVDMSEGEKKIVEIPCADAYGEKIEGMTNEVPKSNLPEGVKVGDTLQGFGPNGPILVTVVEINDETVTIDANHPLAGKDLVFELELLGIAE
jgi:FKBP-type peptidyl-prolyl cis-trans isomerase 2